MLDRSTSLDRHWEDSARALSDAAESICSRADSFALVTFPGRTLKPWREKGVHADCYVDDYPAEEAQDIRCDDLASGLKSALARPAPKPSRLSPLASAIEPALRAARQGGPTATKVLIWITDGVPSHYVRAHALGASRNKLTCAQTEDEWLQPLNDASLKEGIHGVVIGVGDDGWQNGALAHLAQVAHPRAQCRADAGRTGCVLSPDTARAGVNEVFESLRRAAVADLLAAMPDPPPPVASAKDRRADGSILLPAARSLAEIAYVAVGSVEAYTCSGVLVARRAVLTARHCLPATRVFHGEDVRQASAVNERRVVESLTPDGQLDVALLILDKAIEVDIAPRRGSRNDPEKRSSSPPAFVTVAGFGTQETTGRFGYGKAHRFDAAPSGWGCDDSKTADRLGCSPGSDLVLFPAAGHDTCDGDSGGPVVETTPTCHQRIVAVVSHGVSRTPRRCGYGGVYARIDGIADWIDRQLAERGLEKHGGHE